MTDVNTDSLDGSTGRLDTQRIPRHRTDASTGEPPPAHTTPRTPRTKSSGYARDFTDQQDLSDQRDGLQALGVQGERVYVDHGLTGTNRERPGLRQALAACHAGDTLVVTKRHPLARSLPDAAAVQRPGDGRRVRVRPDPEAHLVKLYRAGEHTVSELEELFPVTRSTIDRAIARTGGPASKSSAEAIEPAAVGPG